MKKSLVLLDVDGVLNVVGGDANRDFVTTFVRFEGGHAVGEVDNDEYLDFKSGDVFDAHGEFSPVYRLRFDPVISEHLSQLHRSGEVQFVWCTTWNEDANRFVSRHVGLPSDIPVLHLDRTFRGDSLSGTYWKTQQLPELLKKNGFDGHPFVWFDDEVTWRDRAWTEKNVAARHRLVTVDPKVGLTVEDLDREVDWLLRP